MTEQKINSDAVIMPIVKGKSLQAIESDTYYEGCAFYLEADDHYSIISSVFDNCSFRSDVVFRVIDQCKFYECNYSNHVVFKQSKMSDLHIALSSVAESGVALTQFNWAESNSIENLRIPKSISKLQSLK